MNRFLIILVIYLILINIVAFAGMGSDKKKAIRHKRRTPEKQLFLIAFIGGALGSLLGMTAFRHKTKHASFCVGMPLLLIWNAAVVILLCWKFL